MRASWILGVGTTLLAAGLTGTVAATPPVALDAWLATPARELLTEEEWRLVGTLRGQAELDRFIDWFWARRDPEPETRLNEFRREFELRVDIANRRFGRGSANPGWLTAPGMVQLVMGEPLSIRRGRPVFSGGSFREPVIWSYPDPRDPGRQVQFYFIDPGDGHLELAVDDQVPASRQQLAWLEVARREIVRNDDSRFATVANDLSANPLPASATATRVGSGLLVRVGLPVTSLYGAPVADGILYSLDVALAQGSVSSRLGLAQIRLTLDEVRTSRDRTIELVGWIPLDDSVEDNAPVQVQITELPSRRHLRVAPAASDEMPAVLEISRELCLTELMLGQGSLLAFFGTSDTPANAVARLHIGSERPGTTNIAPGSPLWLERVGLEEPLR